MMNSKCSDCLWIKEHLDLGNSPCCGATPFYMNTQTHLAICPVCKTEWGVPMAVPRLCYDDELYRRFTISIDASLTKQQLLGFSKLIGMNGPQTYRLFKNNLPVIIENIPMIQAYKIRNYFRANGISLEVTPSLDEYEQFEICWQSYFPEKDGDIYGTL